MTDKEHDMSRRRQSIRREANRRAKELLREEEIERRAKQQLPRRRERASDRRAVKTELRRRIFGV